MQEFDAVRLKGHRQAGDAWKRILQGYMAEIFGRV